MWVDDKTRLDATKSEIETTRARIRSSFAGYTFVGTVLLFPVPPISIAVATCIRWHRLRAV